MHARPNFRLPATFSRYSPEITMRLIPCPLAILLLPLLLAGCYGPEPSHHNDEGIQGPPLRASPSAHADERP
ncbi:hypothetical protein [Komagataeibacter xylinus]|uniref:hypothetical protein n=1 Tax=Komagataeibacter xylinus TaxID=28448 RepID=UPI00280BE625|nr:hypothetical protein [Komagataeibacter xylinus]